MWVVFLDQAGCLLSHPPNSLPVFVSPTGRSEDAHYNFNILVKDSVVVLFTDKALIAENAMKEHFSAKNI